MAAPQATTELPIREGEEKGATEQEINPWDVQAGHDQEGNALAFDYVAISKYVHIQPFQAYQVSNRAEQEMGDQAHRRCSPRALRAPHRS
jgi:hypothetical protein